MRKVLSLFPCLLLMAITVMIAAPTVAFAGEEVNWDFGKRIDVLEKKVAELEKRLTECQCQSNARTQVTAVQQHAVGQVQPNQRVQYYYAAPIINQHVPYNDYPVYSGSPFEGGGQYMGGSCSGNSCGLSGGCSSGFFGRRR